jgi:ABC-type transporter Mla subunit MlaD
MPDDVFHWVVAVGVLLACIASIFQAFVLAGLYRAVKEAQKAGKEAQGKLKEVEAKVAPLVEHFEDFVTTANNFLTTSGKLLEENRPRIAGVTAEALAIAKAAREHADRIGELIDDANGRAKARIAQFDETLGATMVQVEHATEAVKSAVTRPAKEVNGIVAGVKAALNTYAQGGNRNSPEHATQDEAMFI